MNSFEFDEDDPVLDEEDYEYAGDGYEMDRIPVEDENDDDDDDGSDDEEIVIKTSNTNANTNADQNKSQASYTDEMNLIDYVIEEEKEIGGNKGEDSLSTSRSTTYSNLFSQDDDDERGNATSNAVVMKKKQKIPAKEEGQMIRARAFLNRLDRKVEEKDEIVKRIRESIYLTKDKVSKMEENKHQLENDIDRAKDQQNVTIANRLVHELNRVTQELSLERDILLDFQSKLDAAEMSRTKAIIERARYNQQESVLKEKEAVVTEQKDSMAKLRQRQEDWKVTQMKRVHLSALSKQKKAIEQQAAAQRSALDEARRSKKMAQKYLQQTFEKVRTEKRHEEEASRTETERKIKSLLNLRNAIERNRDTLSIQTAQKRSEEHDLRESQKREQQAMENEGQNGLFYMLRKEKNEKLEQMQKRFAEQQENNRLVIVDKILKEENEKERKRKLYPELYKKHSTSAPVKQPKPLPTSQ